MVTQLNEKESVIGKLRAHLKSLNDDNEKLSRDSKLMEVKLEKHEQAYSEYEAARLLSEAKVCALEKRLAEFECNRNDLERYKKENELLTARVNNLNFQSRNMLESPEIQISIQEYCENGSQFPNHVQQALQNFVFDGHDQKLNSFENVHSSKTADKFKDAFKIFRPNPPMHAIRSSIKINDGNNLPIHCIHPNNK